MVSAPIRHYELNFQINVNNEFRYDFCLVNREIMQEWVDTLRLKLREMKILSPKENLYSKLPEIRPPLLPTRDPTRDPLPATPPVPAAIVPGVERIVNTTQTSRTTASLSATVAASTVTGNQTIETTGTTNNDAINEQNRRVTPPTMRNTTEISTDESHRADDNNDNEIDDVVETSPPPLQPPSAAISSTSNTLSQNLIKMLYPLPNFSHHQANADTSIIPNECENHDSFSSDNQTTENSSADEISIETIDESMHSLARTFAANVLFEPNSSSSSKRSQNSAANTVCTQLTGAQSINRTNDTADDTISENSSIYGIYPTPEPIVIPR